MARYPGSGSQEEEFRHQVIEENRVYLCKHLAVNRLFPHLRGKNIIDKSDTELIQNKATEVERADLFLDIIKQHGPQAFDEFLEALRGQRTQMFIVDKLQRSVDEKRAIFQQNQALRLRNFNCDLDGLMRPGDPGAPQLPK